MRAVYVRRSNIGSVLLRFFTWSSWSHCGVVTPEGTVIEAAAFHGVVERPASEFMADGVAQFAFKEIPVADDAAAIAWARAQIGKPYDWNGVIGLALRRDSWQDEDAWFCSELVEGACAAGGRRRFVEQVERVTPQSSWMVA
jgi:uncharacterized protein YycO